MRDLCSSCTNRNLEQKKRLDSIYFFQFLQFRNQLVFLPEMMGVPHPDIIILAWLQHRKRNKVWFLLLLSILIFSLVDGGETNPHLVCHCKTGKGWRERERERVQDKPEAAKMIPSTKMRMPKNPRDRAYAVSICWVCGFPGAERRGCWGAALLTVADCCFLFCCCFFSFDPFPSSVLASAPNPNLLEREPSTKVAAFPLSSSGAAALAGLVSSALDSLFSVPIARSSWNLLEICREHPTL